MFVIVFATFCSKVKNDVLPLWICLLMWSWCVFSLCSSGSSVGSKMTTRLWGWITKHSLCSKNEWETFSLIEFINERFECPKKLRFTRNILRADAMKRLRYQSYGESARVETITFFVLDFAIGLPVPPFSTWCSQPVTMVGWYNETDTTHDHMNKLKREKTHLCFKFCFERLPSFLLFFPTLHLLFPMLPLLQKLFRLEAQLWFPILIFPDGAA